jgi:nitroreductase
MVNEHFRQVRSVIINRRTVKPQAMNGMPVNDTLVREILELADYAPNHGMTEPWRFIVYPPEKRISFCHLHAAMYKEHTAEQKFEQAKFDKLYQMGNKASHIVIAIMKRGALPKIPEWEEEAATATAIQNVLLGAEALGIASYWGSGGMAQHQAMKDYLQLRHEDKVMGILYFGYADKQPVFTRNIPMDEKVKWM